jgi:hypothetical protein
MGSPAFDPKSFGAEYPYRIFMNITRGSHRNVVFQEDAWFSEHELRFLRSALEIGVLRARTKIHRKCRIKTWGDVSVELDDPKWKEWPIGTHLDIRDDDDVPRYSGKAWFSIGEAARQVREIDEVLAMGRAVSGK